jgi:uncharacterized protein with ParB-like and HNH nuclease domain
VDKEIEAHDTDLGSIFSDKFSFKVPLYQRPFSWTSEQFQQLLDDLIDASNNPSDQYFIGSFILQKDEGKTTYQVVDGQQRLTSLTILLATIRDKSNNSTLKNKIMSYIYQEEDEWKDLKRVMRVTPWDELRDLFLKYIYKMDGTKNFLEDFDNKRINYRDQGDPIYHIYEAILTFNSKMESDQDKISEFVKFILNKVTVVYIVASDTYSAFKLFTVMNARGLSLSASDLLKSDSLGAIKDDEERKTKAELWTGIEEDIGRKELENVIAFIRTMFLQDKARKGIYEEYTNKILKNDMMIKRGSPFIDYVKEVSDIYKEKIIEGKLDILPEEDKNDYKVLVGLMFKYIPFNDWIPVLLTYLKKYGSVASSYKFVRLLEKKVMFDWLSGRSPTERITSLNEVLKSVEKNDSNTVFQELSKIDKSKFKKLIEEKLGNSDFYHTYGGNLAKYILLRVDKEMWEMATFHGYSGTVTVEHVLPQKPKDGSQWKTDFSEDFRKEWTNKIGNLVLLSGRKNSKAGNLEFSKKKSVYFKEKGTSFKITQEISDYDSWTSDILKSRQTDLIERAKRMLDAE